MDEAEDGIHRDESKTENEGIIVFLTAFLSVGGGKGKGQNNVSVEPLFLYSEDEGEDSDIIWTRAGKKFFPVSFWLKG